MTHHPLESAISIGEGGRLRLLTLDRKICFVSQLGRFVYELRKLLPGLPQGEARILLRQLTDRFGELPAATRQRIETADAETLLHWCERVLTAHSLDEALR